MIEIVFKPLFGLSRSLLFNSVYCSSLLNGYNEFVLCVFRHSFEYLLNFRSTVPSLNTALILTQLLIVLSQYGRTSHSFYREHTGVSAFMHYFYAALFI